MRQETIVQVEVKQEDGDWGYSLGREGQCVIVLVGERVLLPNSGVRVQEVFPMEYEHK